jgi:LPPG:FO 2-phospho-L-lactate transferase
MKTDAQPQHGRNENTQSRIVALAGGVGGAKLAHGLQASLPTGALMVVVNTADDFKLWGLHISPDLDTVMYTLAGLANREWGWGIEGDTWNALDMLGAYGQDTWFRIGDKDLATHVLRTHLLSEGHTLTSVTVQLAREVSVRAHILPMCNEPVETLVQTPEGTLEFQEYFVRHRHADVVTGVLFRGVESASITPEAESALLDADAIIFCPSNPIVSIGPILAVPGMKECLRQAGAPKVAVSPIVGGAALKGPAADMLSTLGHETSAVGVAAIYRGLVDGMVIDNVDSDLAPRIIEMGMEVEVTDTIMKSEQDRARLAQTVLSFCERLTSRSLAK